MWCAGSAVPSDNPIHSHRFNGFSRINERFSFRHAAAATTEFNGVCPETFCGERSYCEYACYSQRIDLHRSYPLKVALYFAVMGKNLEILGRIKKYCDLFSSELSRSSKCRRFHWDGNSMAGESVLTEEAVVIVLATG